jgi:hypothetical protein
VVIGGGVGCLIRFATGYGCESRSRILVSFFEYVRVAHATSF